MTLGKWLRRVLLALLLLLLTVILAVPLALGLLMSREDGSRWLLQQGLGFAPGETRIEQIEGTLLHGLDLYGIHYAMPAVTIEAERLQLALSWTTLLQRRVTVTTLKIEQLAIALHDTDSTPAPDTGPLTLADIPDIRLPVTLAIPGGEVQGFSLTPAGGAPVQLDRILLAASTDTGHQLQLQQLLASQGAYQASLGGTLSLLSPFPVDAWLDWRAPLPPAAQETFASDTPAQGEARLRGDLARLALTHRLRNPVLLTTEGELAPFEAPLRFHLSHQWQPFTVHTPSDAEAGTDSRTLAVAGGTLTLDGTPDAYALTLDSGTSLPDLPTLTVSLQGHGSTTGLAISDARIQADRSSAQIHGQVDWSPRLRWDVALNVTDLDPSLAVPQLPGTLQLRSQASGHWQDGTLELELVIEQLSGTVRGNRVSGGGRFALSEDQTLHSDLQLRAGDNRVSLRGHANHQLDLALAVQANQLSALWPGLTGQLNGTARLQGSRTVPRLNAQLTGNTIGFQGWSLASLSLEAAASNPLNDADIRLALNADTLQQDGELRLDNVRLRGEGSAAQHSVNWALSAPQGTLSGTASGTLTEMRAWDGTLQTLTVSNPLAGTWALEQPVAVAASPDAARLAPACLVSEAGRLCADADWQQQGPTSAQLDLHQLPLAWFTRNLPDGAVHLDGDLALRASYQDDGRRRQGEAQLTVSEGEMQLSSGGEDPYRVHWQGLSANATLENNTVQADARVQLDQANNAEARLSAQLAGDATRLDGELNAALDELRWLEVFVPQLRNVGGRLRSDLRVSGTVSAPRFNGSVQLEDGAAEIPDLGLMLTDIGMTATALPDGTLDIHGSVQSGPGQLTLTGTLLTRGPQPWPVALHIQGERFQAAQLPEAMVLVNPDLRIQLSGDTVTVRGDLRVPEARFELRSLPQQAVGVSRDEVIVSADPTEQSAWQVDTEVNVSLGEKITFEGFGLSASFTGGVRIEDKPERTPRLTGEVRIVDGRYRAFGQNLRVERGTLIFQGPPDNPGLDIVAVRNVTTYDVRAGLIVGGTLQDPRSQVFSEPAMEETEAMAYLLTGRPLNRASDNDANMIVQAIARYGIERGEFITDRLGQTLGVEVGVDTEGEFEDTALMLGKQLSSRLYLRYSVGLFEALNTVMLRYTLTNSLSLETRSNAEEQAIDLIYRTER